MADLITDKLKGKDGAIMKAVKAAGKCEPKIAAVNWEKDKSILAYLGYIKANAKGKGNQYIEDIDKKEPIEYVVEPSSKEGDERE